jgi:AraC-like DNA-binding protein
MGYREHPVDTALGRWVECAWTRAGGERPDGYERIVPDGCMDLIWSERTGVTAVGPNTTAFLAPLLPGGEVVGVRLHPGAAPSLFGLPAPALRDGRLPAAELWGDAGARLVERVAEAKSARERAQLLVAFLAARARRAMGPDALVREAAARLERVPVAEVATELAVSERQLRRRVSAEVGYGPKRLGRVLRLRRALERLRDGADLAEVAYACGYADQAHFTNDCRELAGVAPGRFLQDVLDSAREHAAHDRDSEAGMGDRVRAGRDGGDRVLRAGLRPGAQLRR